ncbi:HNH endonuclease [Enterococcus gallinarum]|uniref:HNH endonuclease n=1 Tax=Enterococcus gallinarum TaxID=1353 RepID=UPI00214C2DB3|nr:HNH endonuclease [Enterococcus gallinarum]MCR1927662.1 HNH endonuclease [Enterococcus gallinarum]
MRIHGEYTIKRRDNWEGKFTKYSDQLCRNYLKEDFFDTCGYCGKKMELLKAKAQIDHFIPKSYAPSKENDYTNLVYSCQKCNRGKWHHWPTQCMEYSYNDKEGFVDPATKEFDLHLERLETGEIVGITAVGKYMVKKMRLDIRPISIMWKVSVLNDKLEKIIDIIENKTKDNNLSELYKVYFETSVQLKRSLNALYSQNESI